MPPIREPHDAAHSVQGPLTDLDDLLDLAGDAAESDSMEEVDAVVRGLRRAALRYAFVLVVALVSVPVLAAISPGWFARPIWGGITLNLLSLAVLLPVLFVLLASGYERFARHVEEQMLGRREVPREEPDA